MTNDELIVEANEIRIVAKEDRSLALFMWNQWAGRMIQALADARAAQAREDEALRQARIRRIDA